MNEQYEPVQFTVLGISENGREIVNIIDAGDPASAAFFFQLYNKDEGDLEVVEVHESTRIELALNWVAVEQQMHILDRDPAEYGF